MAALSAQRWQEIGPHLDRALELAEGERVTWLATIRAQDPSLAADLQSLLDEHRALAGSGFLEQSPTALSDLVGKATDPFGLVGQTLDGRFEVERQVAEGGFGIVYRARQLALDRAVALKVLKTPPNLTAAQRAAFHRTFEEEARTIARLKHPHIVDVHDFGVTERAQGGPLLWMALEWLEGKTLEVELDGRAAQAPLTAPMTPAEALRLLRPVLQTIAYAHRQQVVHRDLKPANIFLADGHGAVMVKVLDFGIAKIMAGGDEPGAPGTARTTRGAPAFSPDYAAPEQIAHGRTGPWTDVHALGLIITQMLTGRPPYAGIASDLFVAAMSEQRPSPAASGHPAGAWEEVLARAVALRPADRYQNADDLLEALEQGTPGTAQPAHRLGAVATGPVSLVRPRWPRGLATAAGVVGALALMALLAWQGTSKPTASWRARWASARIERLTDFAGSEVDAAISANGEFVAFLADREDLFDGFVTQLGSGQFLNLTGGRLPELLNDDERNIGFSAQAAHLWIRVGDSASPAGVSMVPTLGGPLRPFLNTAPMVVWSPDGSKLAYHETIVGDPIYVADKDGGNSRQIFIAPFGVHCHYLSWSPDGRFLYFSHGVPPDAMDIWRIPADGGQAEQITRHDSRTAYPVLLDDRTLFYTATADDGTGPWLYAMDLEDRVAHRVSTAVEHYISIAASDEAPGRPRRLVATVSNPSVHLWTVSITSGVAPEEAATRIELPTARSAAPRFGPDSSLFYLASRGGPAGLWRLSGTLATELWKPSQGAVVGAAAVSPDGKRVCFPVRRGGRSTLYCTTGSGTGAQPMAESLDVRGAASWSPDGRWIAVAAKEGSGVRVFKIPVDGTLPVRLVDSFSSNPIWSPDGTFILYSGIAQARSVPLKAVTPEGKSHPLPALSVDRIGDSYRFLPDGKELVVKLGGFRRQDFWLFDVATGRRRPLTALRPGDSLRRFDVSPDGKRILFERERDNSDVVLIELPPQ